MSVAGPEKGKKRTNESSCCPVVSRRVARFLTHPGFGPQSPFRVATHPLCGYAVARQTRAALGKEPARNGD